MMIRRKGRQSEYQAYIKKFLEHGKDPLKRLKALKHGLEKVPQFEVKEFHTEHASTVFYVFYSSFTTVEAAIQERVNKNKGYSEPHSKDLLEVILPTLEKILVSLPELIHKRWQFNSICLVIRKLLHPENSLKLRQYGIKLLVLWLQALQENAGDACMELFASAVPHFPPNKTPMGLPVDTPSPTPAPTPSSLSLCERYGTYSCGSLDGSGSSAPLLKTSSSSVPLLKTSSTISLGISRDVVCANILHPLGPPTPGLSDQELTLQLMDYLLLCLTSQVGRLKWDDPAHHLRGFAFIFFLFKLFYLACLYKNFRSEAGLYTQPPPPDIELPTDKKEGTAVSEDPRDGPSQEKPADQKAIHKKHVADRATSPYRMTSAIKLDYDLSHPVYAAVKRLILRRLLDWVLPTEQRGGGVSQALPTPTPSPIASPLAGFSFTPNGAELMLEMWFTSQDNVNLLLEICRQGFQMPLSELASLRRVIDLYHSWFQSTQSPEKPLPVFMHPPPAKSRGEASIHSSAGGTHLTLPTLSGPPTPIGMVLPWELLISYQGHNSADIRAGVQASLRMVVAHTSQLFFTKTTSEDSLSSQVRTCKRVIKLYQDIAQSWLLDHGSWEYLLSVLLHLTLHLLKGNPPENRDSTLGGNLAGLLLKTLFVCFLRASLVTKVSPRLWDSLLAVLSSLTQWKEVVTQWKATMETMTHILAQTVYNLNLADLPLNRLHRDDHSRFRPRVRTAAVSELGSSRMASFSQIALLPSKKVGTPPTSKMAHAGRGADDKMIHGKKLRKAFTEVRDDSPSPSLSLSQGPSRRISSPATPFCSLGHVGALPVAKSASAASMPVRSFTSGGEYESKAQKETANSGSSLDDTAVIMSPNSPKSPTFSLPSGVTRYQQLKGGDEEKEESPSNSVIVNPHVASPSPEPPDVEHPVLSKQPGMEMDNRELEKQTKQDSGSYGGSSLRDKRLSDLVVKNREYRSPEPESVELRTSALQSRPQAFPSDLVLKNENLRDSIISEIEETSMATSNAVGLQSESDTQNRSHESETTPPPRPSPLHKSSSESNLAMHQVQLDSDKSSHDRKTSVDIASVALRRVLSSGGRKAVNTKPEKTVTVAVPEDTFSTSIIPQTSTGVISPSAQSPVRGSPLPRLPRTGRDGSASRAGDTTPLLIDSELEEPQLSSSVNIQITHHHPADSEETDYQSSLPLPSSVLRPQPQGPIGWTPVVAAVVWRRMLRILGNISCIKKPAIHAEAMLCLQGIWKLLTDIEANSGISLDNHSTPPLPEFMPPVLVIAPWVLKTCSLPSDYSKGRVVAYQLLCDMTIRHCHTPRSPEQLSHFYRLMHMGLQPTSEVLHVAVKHGCRLFSYGLEGSSVLLSDSIHACAAILKSKTTEAPHFETLCLLGSTPYLLDLYSDMPLPQPGAAREEGAVTGSQLKEKLVDILFMAARKEPLRYSRCLALYQLGMLAFSELRAGQPSRRLPEGVDILLASLQFADRNVSMAAIDMLCLLTEVAPQMRRLYRLMPVRVIEALCYAIASFMSDEHEQSSWVDKIVVTLVLCLRDWLMVLPVLQMAREGTLSDLTFRTVFEVLRAAVSNSKQGSASRQAVSKLSSIRTPVSVSLDPLESTGKSPRTGSAHSFRTSSQSSTRLSSELLKSPTSPEEEDRIQVAARSVLTHLLTQLGHFPFGCGAAQMGSLVREYHDCPSLQHLDELSTEIFDSPRLQFFSFNDTAVITLVEIPTKFEGIPGCVTTANYQTRMIIRDVTGKYTWDSAVLHGPQLPNTPSVPAPSLTKAESMDSLLESLGVTIEPPSASDYVSPSGDPLQPPSWKTHANSSRDVLADLLKHVEQTSPECLLYPGRVGLCEPVPVGSEGVEGLERGVVSLLDQQHDSEQHYIREAFTLPSMCGEAVSAPSHIPSTFAFHYCRAFLGHLGMFSWSKRNHLDVLQKNNQLILELKHLDSIQAQSRQTYKVAVLYVAKGQEDKHSILNNASGSREFEEFVAGLGWEVNMQTHAGYMGGLQRDFCSNCSLPYYATSSEEVLFHVSTRMPSRGRDIEQKVRHLGNDEVHIVWSEHWRDYRRTTFKTQFADILIVIYPLPNKLFRIQINKKQNLLQFGPLFDGVLVDRGSLPSLVRATAINALRAQRNPLMGYRGRYEQRMRYIHSIVERKMKSSYEDFTQNVMHPLESSAQPTSTSTTSVFRHSPQKPTTSKWDAIPAPHSSPPTHRGSPDMKPNRSPRGASLLKLPGLAREHLGGGSPPTGRRPRASTNDDRMTQTHPPDPGILTRNRSVPENLGNLEQTSEGRLSSSQSSPRKGPSPASSRAWPAFLFRTSSPNLHVTHPRTSSDGSKDLHHSHTLPKSK